MRKALLIVLLLTGTALAIAWSPFQPPDKSFAVEFPGKPDPSPGNTEKIFMWGVAVPGKLGYAAGYGILDGFGSLSPTDQQATIDGVIQGMTNRLSEVKRKAGPDGSIDLEGILDGQSGKMPMKLRIFPVAREDRFYVLTTLGAADTRRFFKSFRRS